MVGHTSQASGEAGSTCIEEMHDLKGGVAHGGTSNRRLHNKCHAGKMSCLQEHAQHKLRSTRAQDCKGPRKNMEPLACVFHDVVNVTRQCGSRT